MPFLGIFAPIQRRESTGDVHFMVAFLVVQILWKSAQILRHRLLFQSTDEGHPTTIRTPCKNVDRLIQCGELASAICFVIALLVVKIWLKICSNSEDV